MKNLIIIFAVILILFAVLYFGGKSYIKKNLDVIFKKVTVNKNEQGIPTSIILNYQLVNKMFFGFTITNLVGDVYQNSDKKRIATVTKDKLEVKKGTNETELTLTKFSFTDINIVDIANLNLSILFKFTILGINVKYNYNINK